jgi:FemAB-related protein (PEP-CTERM system-associated)
MSLRIEQCLADQESQWNSFLELVPNSTYNHLIGWQRAIESTYNLKIFRLIVKDNEEWVGIVPVAIMPKFPGGSRKAVSLPYSNYGGLLAAPGVNVEPLKAVVIKYLSDIGINRIEMRDLAPAMAVVDEVTMLLTLPDDSGQLWKQVGDKIRNQIRKAERSGLKLQWGSDQGDALYDIYAKNMGRLGTPVHSPKFFTAILANLGEHADVLTVRLKDRSIGAMLIIKNKDTWSDPFASCLREFNSMNPNMLLYWEALRTAAEAGAESFDFGRSHINSGTYRFKKQWGAREIALNYYSYLKGEMISSASTNFYRGQNASKLAYIWRQLPEFVQIRLGPLVRRWLP